MIQSSSQQEIRSLSFAADRSSSIYNLQHKISLNRTESNYYGNDSLSKLSPSLTTNNCCHSHCSRVSPSTQTFVSSPSSTLQNGRRYQMSGPTSSSSSLLDDDHQLTRRISNGDEIDCTTKLTCTITTNDGFRRKKSASLNSPANSGRRSDSPPRDEVKSAPSS
jgi:hypothetical protein